MSWASKSYTFSPSNIISSSEVNQNFDDLVDGLNSAMPSGGIIMWSGSSASIPSGWYLCDGNNGTPNLVNRFVVGATGSYSVDSIGGSTSSSISHTHTYSGTTSTYTADVPTGGSSGTNKGGTHNHTFSGTTSTPSVTSISVLPPYYALCYIMKS